MTSGGLPHQIKPVPWRDMTVAIGIDREGVIGNNAHDLNAFRPCSSGPECAGPLTGFKKYQERAACDQRDMAASVEAIRPRRLRARCRLPQAILRETTCSSEVDGRRSLEGPRRAQLQVGTEAIEIALSFGNKAFAQTEKMIGSHP